jgi:plastocyanin
MPAKPHVDRVLFAGLLALFAIPGHAADPWSNAQPMTVIMVDDRFQPDHLTFHAGTTYELRLENRGKDLHEFTAPEFFHATTVRDKRLLANGGIEVVVQPGRSARVLLLPRVKGEYKLTCADHDWDGMIGTITVE